LQYKNVPEVEIIEHRKVNLQEPLVILGFAGPGLVGGIAVSHIIDQLKMKEIAHVRSRYIPPAIVFMDGKLRHAFRVYSDQKGELCAIVCEIPLRSDGAFPISSTLLEWVEEKGAKELVVLEGVPVQGYPKTRQSFCAAEMEKIKECEKKGVKKITAGIIQGIAGSILDECLTRKITGVVYLTHVVAFMPDPEGAAVLIDTMNHVYGLGVDTKILTTRAEEIKRKLKEVAESGQKMRQAEEKRGIPERVYI
jgi:uncharacterized protein